MTTERTAWELLQIVDQIHIWGATDFRDFVIQHLRPWHEFGRRCYGNDIGYTHCHRHAGLVNVDGQVGWEILKECLELPGWTRHVTEDTRSNMQAKLEGHMRNAFVEYNANIRSGGDDFGGRLYCIMDECRREGTLGYPLMGLREVLEHVHEFHGEGPGQAAADSSSGAVGTKRGRSGDPAGPGEKTKKRKKQKI